MVNNKVEIVIVLNELDHVGVKTSSKNLVTNLGLLEIAAELLKKMGQKEQSNIVVPSLNA